MISLFRAIKNEYFDWLRSIIKDENEYNNLLYYLFNRDFTYVIDLDENRANDGLDLRYRFEYDHGYEDIMDCISDKPCSVLEMLIALSIACEESIMYDPEYGDRTDKWFWGMIRNLGLSRMTDSEYDDTFVEECINIFLNREYAPNGEGGLFTLKSHLNDLRDVEIWYQLCLYLDEILGY